MFTGRAQSKRRALAILNDLVLPDPWNSRELVDRIAERRGRPITVTAVPPDVMNDSDNATEDKVCGLWVNTDDHDYLLYSAEAPALTADLTICHELGHMLFAHELSTKKAPDALTPPPFDLDGLTEWLPDLDPDAVRALLGRSSFSARREFEAEYLATLMMDRARGGRTDSRRHRMMSTFLGEFPA